MNASALLSLGFDLLVLGVVYLLPGWLLLLATRARLQPWERLVYGLATGLVLVNLPVVFGLGLAGLSGPAFLSAPLVVGASLSLSALLGLWLVRRAKRDRGIDSVLGLVGASHGGWLSTGLPLLGLTAFAFGVYLLNYDAFLFGEDLCDVRASAAQVGPYWQDSIARAFTPDGSLSPYQLEFLRGIDPQRNAFLTANQDQRLYPSVLLGPFLALFGPAAYRLVFALAGLLLPGFGFVLGRALFGKPWAGWLTAVLLAFNPYTMEAQFLDLNHMALVFGSMALAALLSEKPLPWLAGLGFAFFLGLRHEAVLVLPFALAWLAPERAGRWRAVVAFLGLTLTGLLPDLVFHLLRSFGEWPSYEPFTEFFPQPHRIFGLTFDFSYLLNYPFVDAPARSPYMAFPTLLAFPLDLLRHLGLAWTALIAAGVAHLWRRNRRSLLLLAGWFVPLLSVLCLLSNWVEPNKMGIHATGFTALAVLAAAGVLHLIDGEVAPWRRAVPPLIGVLLPMVAWGAFKETRHPLDGRVLDSSLSRGEAIAPTAPDLAPESPEFVAWDRQEYRLPLLPEMRLERWRPGLVGLRWRQWGHEASQRSFRDYRRPLPDELARRAIGLENSVNAVSGLRVLVGGPVTAAGASREPPSGATTSVELRLDLPPALDEQALAMPSGGGEPWRIRPGEVHLLAGLQQKWSTWPENLLVAMDEHGVVHVVLVPLRGVSPAMERDGRVVRHDSRELADGRLVLEVPDRSILRLIQMRGFRIKRSYVRYAGLGDNGSWVNRTEAVWF